MIEQFGESQYWCPNSPRCEKSLLNGPLAGQETNRHVQWGSKYWRCLYFEWSKCVRLWNGPIFEWFWTKWQPKCPGFKCFHFAKTSGSLMFSVCFRNVRFWVPLYFVCLRFSTIIDFDANRVFSLFLTNK